MSPNKKIDQLLRQLQSTGMEDLDGYSAKELDELWKQSQQNAYEEFIKATKELNSVHFSEFLTKNRTLIIKDVISILAPIMLETTQELIEKTITNALKEKGL